MDKKFAFQIVGLLIVTFVAMTFVFKSGSLLGGSRNLTIQPSGGEQSGTHLTIINGEDQGSIKARIDLEIADTREKRNQGLSGRQSLGQNSGMIFMMESEGKPTFWMKNMLISLDFIWILDNRVVDILRDVPPPEEGQQDDTLPRYSPVTTVNRVLEVNSGFVVEKGIKIGDIIEIGSTPLATESPESAPSPN